MKGGFLPLADKPFPVFKHSVNLDAPFHIPKFDPEQMFHCVAIDKRRLACSSVR